MNADSLCGSEVQIPDQLCRNDLRFILTARSEKRPIEKQWESEAYYPYSHTTLTLHLKRGGGYGTFPAPGSPLIIIDADNVSRLDALRALDGLPETFTVETGGSTSECPKRHYYYQIDGDPLVGRRTFLDPTTNEHLGEVFAQHPERGKGYVIGPGSLHPSGNVYRVLCDAPIATLSGEQWKQFSDSVQWNRKQAHIMSPPRVQTSAENHSGSLGNALNLKVTDVWPIPTTAQKSGDEVKFAHPVHGSTTGTNLGYNVQKDVWHCYRCDSGGDALLALAVDAGIINCEDAHSGALDDPKVMGQVMEELRHRGFDVDRALQRHRGQAAKGAAEATITPSAPEEDADPEIDAAAREILEHDDPFEYLVKTYNIDHVGDVTAGQCCILSLASRLILNCKGLHVMATGSSGKGKTDVFRSVLRQVPDRFKLDGSFSDKTLFYKGSEGTLKEGTVLLLDDKGLSPNMEEIIKEAASDFRRPIHHHTLNKEHRSQTVTIPCRCIWWIAKVEGVGDDQIFNRMLMPWVDDSDLQDHAVVEAFLEEESRDDDHGVSEPREVVIARKMWDLLDKERLIDVSLSRFASRIRFGSYRNRRNNKMFVDMIKSVARLRSMQRERRTLGEGTVRIYADEEDFRTAAAVFTALHLSSGGQETKMTKRESDLLDVIVNGGIELFDVAKIQNLTGLSYQSVYNAICGSGTSHGKVYSGLVEKCPAITPSERSESVRVPDDEDNRKTHTIGRFRRLWSFDKAVYHSWKTRSVVWLNPPEDDSRKLPDNSRNPPGPDENNDGSGNSRTAPDSLIFSQREKVFPENMGSDKSQTETTPSGADRSDGFSSLCSMEFREFDLKNSEHPLIVKESDILPIYPPGTIPDLSGNSGRMEDSSKKISFKINPGDFVEIPEKYEIGACSCCGGRHVHYRERSHIANARGSGATTIRICRDCYNRAKILEVEAIQILPGTIPIGEIVQVDHPEFHGRCTVCNLEPVKVRHPESRAELCEACYAKIIREQVDIR